MNRRLILGIFLLTMLPIINLLLGRLAYTLNGKEQAIDQTVTMSKHIKIIASKLSFTKKEDNVIKGQVPSQNFFHKNSTELSEEYQNLSKLMSSLILDETQLAKKNELLNSEEIGDEVVRLILDDHVSELDKNQAIDILIQQFERNPNLALSRISEILKQKSDKNELLIGYQAEIVYKLLDKNPSYREWIESNWSSSFKDRILSNIANLEYRE